MSSVMAPSQSEGHIALTRNAQRAMGVTLRAHSAYAECWSGLVGLYYIALKGEHESPHDGEEPEHVAWHLRHSLLTGALDTSKLALDATLSGYYAQALMLIRHLFETWLQVRYARIRADQAVRWFNSVKTGPPMEPGYESIIKEVLKAPDNKDAAISVNHLVHELRRAAHPSSWLVDQVRDDGTKLVTLGGRYREKWAVQAFDRGTLATIALLLETKRQVKPTDEWQVELDRLIDLRNSNYLSH